MRRATLSALTLPALLCGACTTPNAARALVAIPSDAAPAPTSVDPRPQADASKEELAKQLQNPVAALVSVPFQLNYDRDIGPGDQGERLLLNVQPVVPITLNEEWNLISRTILPVVQQWDVPPGNDESGLGDVVQSAFFSPVAPTAGGWIWGAGPVLLLPTASDELLGQEQLGVGPTAVALKQDGPWTYGALANHLWKVAGDGDRPDVNATFLQPFASYTTPKATSFVVNSESTYDWNASQWSVPVNLLVSQVLKVSDQLLSVTAGVRYWVESPESGPEGLGFRLQVVLLFPR